MESLRWFDPRKIPKNSVCAFLGRRKTGKTECMRDIMYHHRDVDSVVVISPTEIANQNWRRHVPSTFIYTQYDSSIIINVIKRQATKIKQRGKADPVLIICDDCMYDNTVFTRDKVMRFLLMNGRHFNIMFFMAAQYMMDIDRGQRTQFDYLFLFKENNWGNIDRLFQNFGGCVETLKEFKSYFDTAARDFGCLVIDVNATSSNVKDCLFWYKAKLHQSNFKVGSESYWLYHLAHEQKKENNVDEIGTLIEHLQSTAKGKKKLPVVKRVV